MSRPCRRLIGLFVGVAAAFGLSGCAIEYKLPSNTPARTQRPSGYHGIAKAAPPKQASDRQRVLDEWMRGKKRAPRVAARPGDVSDRSNMPAESETGQGSGTVDDALDETRGASAAQQSPSCTASGQIPEDPADKGTYYVVKKGDTVLGLSRRFGVPTREIQRWNPREVHEGLPVGCSVYIPTRSACAVPAPKKSAPPLSRASAIRSPQATKVASFRPGPAKSAFMWPVAGTVVSKFGFRHGRPHTGLDIKTAEGTPIRAAMAGKVIYSGMMRGYGKVIILDHQNGYFSVYSHNERNLVKRSQTSLPTMVRKGQIIATVGQSGNATAPHVHFEIRRSNDALDPLKFLPKRSVGPIARRAKPKPPVSDRFGRA